MIKTFTQAPSRLALLLLCTLPLLTQAASRKEAPLDLSIIKQSDTLQPEMTSQQRSAFLQAKQLIKQGESDIRSGENLQAQKRSALNPNKDLKPIHKRGEQLVEKGQATVRSGQQQMIELLTAVKTRLSADQTVSAQKYNFNLAEATYPSALEQAATETLENCRNAGYKNVLYDGLRIISPEQNLKAASKAHNTAYDIFIQADGKQFSVKLPLDLKLVANDTTGEYAFQYENASVFEGEKVALLAIEVIAPNNGVEALLSVRALDIDSQQLISSTLSYIANASEVLKPKTEATTDLTSEVAEATSDQVESVNHDSATGDIETPRTIPVSVSINDQNQLIEKLAGIATPYLFETVSTANTTVQSILIAGLLKDTLLKNSALLLVESDFIQRSYLPAEIPPEGFPSVATATLTITPDADNYTLTAKAHASDRALDIGTLTLHLTE